MKYLKKLINRKKYAAVLIFCLILILGFFCFYINFLEVIINNIQGSDLSFNGIFGSLGLGIINIFLGIIGILLMYISLFSLPRVSYHSQNHEDYYVKF